MASVSAAMAGGAGFGLTENFVGLVHDSADLAEQFDFGRKFGIAGGKIADAIDDFEDAVGQVVLRAGKFFGSGFVLVGRDGSLGLFGDASVFAKIHFGFEDL